MSQNLQNFVKFQKFQLENLVDFEKCCKTHIFLQKSEPIQPKTSNILPKFCQPTLSDVSAGLGPVPRGVRREGRGRGGAAPEGARAGAHLPQDGLGGGVGAALCFFELKCIFRKCIFRKYIFRKFCKFLAGSFSAVSKRNFARKYAFDSIFQALPDLHPFAPLQSQIFCKKSV